MNEQWVNLRDAARIMRVTLRTIQRRAKDGTLESRHNGQGKEVWIDLDDIPQDDSDNDATATYFKEQAKGQLLTTGALVQQADRLAETFRTELKQSRRWGRAGWIAAAILLVATVPAAWWTAKGLTSRDANLRHATVTASMQDKVHQAAQERIDALVDERDLLQEELNSIEGMAETW